MSIGLKVYFPTVYIILFPIIYQKDMRSRLVLRAPPPSQNIREILSEFLTKLEQRIDGLEQRMEQRMDGMEQRMEKKIDNMDKRISKVENKILDKINILSSRIGRVSENSYRHTLEDRLGKMFVRPFLVSNLIGLGRLVVSKNSEIPNVDSLTQIEIAKKLSEYVIDNHHLVNKLIDDIRNKVAKIAKNRGKPLIENPSLKDLWDKLNVIRKNKEDGEVDYLIDILRDTKPENYFKSAFGLAAFISDICPKDSLQSQVEFDMRGQFSNVGGYISYSFGELKSADSISASTKGEEQLLLRAKMLHRAFSILTTDFKNISITGYLFIAVENREDTGVKEKVVEEDKFSMKIITEKYI